VRMGKRGGPGRAWRALQPEGAGGGRQAALQACPHLMRVMTTPQGTGAPTNLCPLTLTLPMGFLKVTMGAWRMKGIIMPNSAPSQWM